MTIMDLAKNLNVSYSTVSKSLNNDPHVSAKTRARVLAEAQRTGFVFNQNARGLASSKTRRVGILFSNNFNNPNYRWFYGEIETFATRAIEELGYEFIIQPHLNIHGESNIIRMIRGNMVDGYVIFSRNVTREEYNFLNDNQVPHTYGYLNPMFLHENHPDLFIDDNENGGYIATRHLIEHGHKAILTIRDDLPMKAGEDRTVGYRKAMAEAGYVPSVLEMPMTFDAARRLLRERMDYLRRYSAIFVQQDRPALSMILEFQRRYGIRVPQDISIVGYNNIDMIEQLDMPLDTIDDHREQVICSAVKAVISMIKGKKETIKRISTPILVARGSVQRVT